MKIEHLRECTRLAQTLSFTQTAREFSITQPVLSKHVSNLERELGAKLLIRSQHGLSLTKAGESFMRDAIKIIDEYDAALDHLQQTVKGLVGSLTVGYLAGASKKILPPAVAQFTKDHPDVTLKLISLEIDEILDALSSDRIDMGITTSLGSDNPDPKIYGWKTLYPDHIALLVPNTHRLASRKHVSILEVAEEDILLTAPSFMTNDERVTETLEPIKETARFHHEALDMESNLAFMETGRYIAIALAHFENFLGEGYSFIPIDEAKEMQIKVGILWKKDRYSAYISDFIETLESQLAQNGTS